MLDLLITGGTVVLAEGSFKADIAVQDGKVTGLLQSNHTSPAKKVIDASEKLVMPGGIDPHVHFNVPFMGTVARHDFYTGTVSAAFGGVTTVIDFAIQRDKSFLDTLVARRAEADGNVVIDYGLHGVPTKMTPTLAEDLKQAIDWGMSSLKVFMIYRNEWMLDDGGLYVLLETCAKHGGLAGVHAENDAIAEYRTQKLLAEGKTAARYHCEAKPNLVEAEAMHRAIYLANQIGAGLYIFHMSCAEGVEMIKAERSANHPIYAETCTHYLALTRDVYDQPNGHRLLLSPPLRDKVDQDRLWEGLRDGTVSATSSDDSAYDLEAKDKLGGGNFAKTPNGTPGAEFRLPVIWTLGVNTGRLTPSQFVAVTSTNAAKIFGMYPQKGTIAVGSDADIVVFDPHKQVTIGYDTLHMHSGWSPLEDFPVVGYPIITVSKGEVVVEDGQFKGTRGHGKFLSRRISPEALDHRIV